MPNWWMELDLNKNIFVNVSENILVAFWHMCYKVTQLKRRLSKRCTRMQARMHTQGEVSHVLFSKVKQIWKIFSKNTLVNCMTQPFLFIDTILKVSKRLLFSHFIKKISCFECLAACLVWQFLCWRQYNLKLLAKIYQKLGQQKRLSNI